MPVNNTIQIRKGSAETWISTNPILANGEPGFDTTNNILKIGNGTSTWSQLNPPAVSGVAGGDLTGSYPNPMFTNIGISGTYTKVTTDSKGRVTSGTTLSSGDLPSHNHSASDVNSGTLADARLSTAAQSAINLYLWSSFR